MRLFRSNLRKLIRRPATWVTFLLLAALVLLIFVAVTAGARQATRPAEAIAAKAVVTFPGAYAAVAGLILGIGGMLAVVYGAAIAGSEWTWGTLKAAVARGEGRVRYIVMGYLAVVAYVIVGLCLVYLLGVACAAGGATVLGISLSGMNDSTALGQVPEELARGALALSMDAALGFTIATIARSQLAGIGVGIGAYFAEGIAGVFLPDVIKWLPFSAATAVLARSGSVSVGGAQAATSLDPNTAVIVVAAWLLGALVVSSAWTERAEISG